jgi:hypothetical protein
LNPPTVTVEPGDGSVVYYQPLAKEATASIDKCRIGIWVDIKNNESFEITLTEAFVSFPNDVQKYPLGPPLLYYVEGDTPGSQIPVYWTIPIGGTKGLGMTGGSHNGGGGQQIIKPSPPPPEITISLKFKEYDLPVLTTRPLKAYLSPVGGYKFPGKSEDLQSVLYRQFWQSLDSHIGGGDEIFAHDLGVLAWNSTWSKYDRIRSGEDGTLNEHYLVWKKPVYAMASGEVLSFENDIDDNPLPGNVPDPQYFNNNYCGNGFVIRHDTYIVYYCHMKKGSLNPDLMQNNHPLVNEGDFLGLAGNSGSSSEPHLHIGAVNMTSGHLRPLLFRDIQVLSVDALSVDSYSTWVHVNGKGLPAIWTAVWPSAEPIPKWSSPTLSKWEAFARIIFGIVGDGGGLWVTPGYRPLPPPPPDPLRSISGNKIDALMGLALTELASIASSEESRKTIQEAGIRVMENAIAGLKKEMKLQTKK